MFIDFLGAHGGKDEGQNNTCVQVQDDTLIDAGNILEALGHDRSLKINRIFLTHSHMDHISDIPFLIDSVFSQRKKPIEIWGLEHTIQSLKDSIFNWSVWPDFSSIPLIGTKDSAVVFHTLEYGQTIKLEEVSLTTVKANHTVPCVGYVITQNISGNAIYLSGDTYKSKNMWDTINENKNIKTAIIDVSFPSFCYQLGIDSGHLTPKALEEDALEHLKREDINLCIYHTKPSHYDAVVYDLNNLKLKQDIIVLHDNSKVYFDGRIDHDIPKTPSPSSSLELTEKIRTLNEIGMSLSGRNNIQELVEDIVIKTNSFIEIDGLSLYFISSCEKYLEFQVIQTKSLDINMRNTQKNVKWDKIPLFNVDGSDNTDMVVCVSANENRVINIDDIYNCSEYSFNGAKTMDEKNNYRSQSMIIVPMTGSTGKIVGVLQLINRLDTNNNIIGFNQEDQLLMSSLASQVSIVLSNKMLVDKLETLFDSFIQIIGNAVDETSEYTGGHIRKVSALALILAEYIDADKSGFYKDVSFTKDEFKEIEIASWIHDIGKITVPEHKLDKATKLETTFDRIEYLKAKFEIRKRDLKIQLLEYQLKNSNFKEDSLENIIAYEEKIQKAMNKIDENVKFLEINNIGKEFMPIEVTQSVIEMSLDTLTIDGRKEKLINSNEVMNLAIQAGTLTFREKEIVKKHAYVGYELLGQLSFPHNLKDAVDIACNHHECLNGTGYPRGLTADHLTVKDRIMILADIFEALTSADRPYKDAKTLAESFKILGFMVKDGKIDGDMIKFFIESGACKEFSENYLMSSQINDFKLSF